MRFDELKKIFYLLAKEVKRTKENRCLIVYFVQFAVKFVDNFSYCALYCASFWNRSRKLNILETFYNFLFNVHQFFFHYYNSRSNK